MSKDSVIADLNFKDLNGQDLPGTEKSIQLERERSSGISSKTAVEEAGHDSTQPRVLVVKCIRCLSRSWERAASTPRAS